MKNTVIVAGSNSKFGSPPASNFITFAYSACADCDCVTPLHCCDPLWINEWTVPESALDPTARYGKAADMDVVFGLDSHLYAMVVGRATSFEAGGTTGVASMVYDAAGTRVWPYGGLWNRRTLDGGTGDDEGITVRCIRALDTGFDPNSPFLAYIAVASATASGWDYATLKYDGFAPLAGGTKELGWDLTRIPFYNGPANANDLPSGIAVEYNPGIMTLLDSRRIWITGTSNGGASSDDWATQFVVEKRDQ
jgi:hypothetical protein